MPPFLAALFSIIPTVLDRVLPGDSPDDRKMKLDLQRELNKGIQELDLSQLEINKIEAANPNLFVSGGRPFIIWICGYALFMVVNVALYQWFMTGVQPDLTFVWSIMGTLLGLGSMRTYEKAKGVATASASVGTKKPPSRGGKLVDGIWKEEG